MRSDGWGQFDTVRLVLAAVVAVGHTSEIFLNPFVEVPTAVWLITGALAQGAVLAFFLISGLVIGRSLVRSAKHGDLMFFSFMKKRFARIYPPLLFSVALAAFLAWVLTHLHLEHYSGPATRITRNSFSYLANWPDVQSALLSFGFRGGLTGSSNGPLWSLALEMQAYVFAGLVAQIIAARTILVKVASVVVLIIALRMRGLHGLDFYQFACFGLFAAGIGVSFLPLRFPNVLPVVRLDFSYSLYILHFPITLFIFFLTCQGVPPSLTVLLMLIVTSLFVTILVSMASGLVFERRVWMSRIKAAASTA